MPYVIRVPRQRASNTAIPQKFWRRSDFFRLVIKAWRFGKTAQYSKSGQSDRTVFWDGLKVQFYESFEVWTVTTEEKKLWTLLNQPGDVTVVEDTP